MWFFLFDATSLPQACLNDTATMPQRWRPPPVAVVETTEEGSRPRGEDRGTPTPREDPVKTTVEDSLTRKEEVETPQPISQSR